MKFYEGSRDKSVRAPRVLRDIVSVGVLGLNEESLPQSSVPGSPSRLEHVATVASGNTKPSEGSEEQRHGRGDLLGGGGGPRGAGGPGDPVLGAGGEETEQGGAGQEEAQTQAQAPEQPDTL